VLYIISGAGGAPLYDADQTGDSASWQPYTVRFIANVHSFTAVNVVGPRLVLRQIAEDGRELDRITVTKAHDIGRR
jgi:acid phosphatase type 7